MLSGCYVHGVDEKNRISIPARFREQLSRRFTLTRGPDGCLWALSPEQWETVLSRSGGSLALQRFFVAPAVECAPGPRGRCLIPDSLRRHADIKPGDEVTIVGMMNRVEIWSARRWEAICSAISADRLRQDLPELFE